MKEKTILERLSTEKNLIVYTKDEDGKMRYVRDIRIFSVTLPPSYYKSFDPQNILHVENSKLPDMVIRGRVGNEVRWWDENGMYYDIDITPGISTSKDLTRVPEKDLLIL